jgi:uncharacterized protein YkwD
MMRGLFYRGRCRQVVLSAVPIPSSARLFVLLGALLAAGCTASPDFTAAPCVPGMQFQCHCVDGSLGFATCAPDGVHRTECQCGQPITSTEPIAPPTSGAAATGEPVTGSGGVQTPMAGSPPVEQPPTGGIELVDAGVGEMPIDAIDAGRVPTGDGGPGPSVVDSGTEPTDSGTTDVQPNPNQDEVPATAHCAPVSDWDPAWTQWEDEVLALTNEARAQGASCGQYGSFGPAEPLSMSPELRCSARLHSKDMAERGFFDHTNPDGVDPFARMAAAGYSGSSGGENIAMGQPSPTQVVQGWMSSDGHCRNIMSPNFTLIGVGYYSQPGASPWFGGHYWTQNFGGAGFNWTWR